VPDSPYTTFVAKRFDRTPEGHRVPFVSAMTLTQRSDGEAGASYLELVDLLQSRGAATRSDCIELFRRVVFSILVHNTDDHLRNHGFFLGQQGITLAPAYDLNPSNEAQELSLAINETDGACDVSLALGAHADYGLSVAEAKEIIARTTTAVASWRREAARLRIPRAEQD
jgi:serine/threonine-protein kinase HipA